MLPRQDGGRGGQPRNFVPPTTQVASAVELEHGMALCFHLGVPVVHCLHLVVSLNQQSNPQRLRATLSGSTLGEFVIQVSNRRFVSTAQTPKCDHIPILCASQCSCRACMLRAQRVQPVLHFIILCMFMFQSVQLSVHFHVCFVFAAD